MLFRRYSATSLGNSKLVLEPVVSQGSGAAVSGQESSSRLFYGRYPDTTASRQRRHAFAGHREKCGSELTDFYDQPFLGRLLGRT